MGAVEFRVVVVAVKDGSSGVTRGLTRPFVNVDGEASEEESEDSEDVEEDNDDDEGDSCT